MKPREGGMTTDASSPSLVKSELSRGAVIAGRYHLETRLGGGGGGTVWRCHDDKLDTTVALKIVAATGDVERWRREVAMARRIADRNVCRVHDLGEMGELRFVTMELIEGTSLRQRVRSDLPADEARALLLQVVSGTAAIHAAGVVHRDLKPDNIVVATDGRAVIVDFGLAREPQAPDGEPTMAGEIPDAAATLNLRVGGAPRNAPTGATVTSAGVAVGTPRYMSPEQAAGDAVDARTDVWALGLIGHELLTGALPRLDPDSLHGRQIDPAIEAKLPGATAVLRRCLASAPDERYGDARALHAALVELGGHRLRHESDAALAEQRGSWRRRIGLAIGLAGAAMLVGAVVMIMRTGSRGAGSAGRSDAVATAGSADGTPSARSAVPPTGEAQLFPIMSDPGRWPSDAPVSVAVAPDGKRFAYTTAGGSLLVRSLAPGAAADKWTAPTYQPEAAHHGESMVTMWCAGWFSDDSIAVIGATFHADYHLFRVYRDRAILLHSQSSPFTAAVASGDRVAIGITGDAVFLLVQGQAPDQILPLGPGEQAIAIASSPDGRQVAVARQPATGDTRIEIVGASGGAARAVWSGRSVEVSERWALRDMLLVWLDDHRLAFTRRDPASGATTISTLDARTAELRDRGAGSGYGIGSAAGGTVLMIRTEQETGVQIANAKIDELAPAVANAATSRVAGWTSDGRLVFAMGTPPRIVRAVPGRGAEPWPGASDGEIPDSVINDSAAGDSVIAHRLDPAAPSGSQVVVERITADGKRNELARLPADRMADTVVRCAGDRAAPCMLQDIAGQEVRWVEVDLRTGQRGRVLHSRGTGGRRVRDAALSLDGKTLAIVEGTSELIVVPDLTVGETRTYAASGDASLQSVSFASTGDIWATSLGFQGRLFGLMVFEARPSSHGYSGGFRRGSPYKHALRWFYRPTVNLDGTQVAAWVREIHPQIVRVQGL